MEDRHHGEGVPPSVRGINDFLVDRTHPVSQNVEAAQSAAMNEISRTHKRQRPYMAVKNSIKNALNKRKNNPQWKPRTKQEDPVELEEDPPNYVRGRGRPPMYNSVMSSENREHMAELRPTYTNVEWFFDMDPYKREEECEDAEQQQAPFSIPPEDFKLYKMIEAEEKRLDEEYRESVELNIKKGIRSRFSVNEESTREALVERLVMADRPILSKAYLKQFSRSPVGNERPCVRGIACLGVIVSKIHPHPVMQYRRVVARVDDDDNIQESPKRVKTEQEQQPELPEDEDDGLAEEFESMEEDIHKWFEKAGDIIQEVEDENPMTEFKNLNWMPRHTRGVPFRELLMPEELRTLKHTGQNPQAHHMCRYCEEFITTFRVYMYKRRNREVFDVLQRYQVIIDRPGEYKKSECLPLSHSNNARTGIVAPFPRFNQFNYIFSQTKMPVKNPDEWGISPQFNNAASLANNKKTLFYFTEQSQDFC